MEPLPSPANLLILTIKEEDAEAIIMTLRNGGLAVRGTFTDDPQRVQDLLGSQTFELIICCDWDPGIELDSWMMLYQELRLEVPLIVIAAPNTDANHLINAMRNGARDVAEKGDTEHLQLVVARELSDLEFRRQATLLQGRLRECERRARQGMDASGEAVALVQEGFHIQTNPAYQELFRFTGEQELDGYPLLDLIAPDKQNEIRRSLRLLDRLGETESTSIDVQCIRADSVRFDAHLTLSKTSLDGDPCLRILVEEGQGQAATGVSGGIDRETGLPNRSALTDELTRRLERKGTDATPVAVIYVAVDVFSRLVQAKGLTTGLNAAADVGASLRKLTPPDTFLARLSDDGFILLIDAIPPAEASRLSWKIVDTVHLPPVPGVIQGDAPVCSAGIIIAQPGTDSTDETLDIVYRDHFLGALETDSDSAPSSVTMSRTPDSGYHSEISQVEREFGAQIHRALEGNGFELVYQPIVSLKGDSQENYNVFLRLRDDQKRLRAAKEFLSAVNHSGHMIAVDRWVIRHAIEELVRQRRQDRKISFFVNIAEETLQEHKLLIWICDYLREYQARGNWLTFQVLEDHARRHAAAFIKLSEGLKKVKCKVAINNFGLGPSPEILLDSLPANYIKFAPEFGYHLADDAIKQKKLMELAAIVREAGRRSVVTGVEDARTLTILWSAGIDYVQGNFLQNPSPDIEPQ